MLKKSITYTNLFTGQEITEDHFFHISKADIVEMEVIQKGGMEAYLTRIRESEDGKAVITVFKELLRRSYGKKDGDRFIKSDKIWEEFYSSEAYSQLFFELCTDAEKAAEFWNGMVPQGLEADVAKITAKNSESSIGLPTPIPPRILTQVEVAAMDSDELKSGLATGRYKLS